MKRAIRFALILAVAAAGCFLLGPRTVEARHWSFHYGHGHCAPHAYHPHVYRYRVPYRYHYGAYRHAYGAVYAAPVVVPRAVYRPYFYGPVVPPYAVPPYRIW